VASTAGSTSFTVTSNTSWNAASDQGWCTVTPSGTGNGTIIANYLANGTSTPRLASITVSATGPTPVLVTVTQAGTPFKTLNLVLFLEGFFDFGTGTMRQTQESLTGDETFNKFPGTTVDTLSVILANAADPWAYVYQAHGQNINPDGSVTLSIPSSLSGNYYIVIRQRNSIETWSGAPVSFAGNTVNYNFTNSAGQAYGNNMRRLFPESSVYALYMGDMTSMTSGQDGYVDIFDNNAVFNKVQGGGFGYIVEDLTGDGYVDIFDLAMVFNNMQTSVGMNTPPNPAKKK
jgi:hypothetical protein